MQDKKINFLPRIYSKKPTLINSISFTPREMDVIACLLNARGTNKTSYLLDIAPKTVRRNIENLREKLGCSSREGIIDFIEKANKQALLRTHYSHLLIDAEFKKHLKKISKTTRSPCSCSLIFYKEPKDTSELTIFLETLKENLELAGMKTTIELLEIQNFIAHLHDLPENEHYSIYILQKRLRDKDENDALNMEAITARVRQQSLFLILERKDLEKAPENLYGIDCLDFNESKNYYLSVFDILKSFSQVSLLRPLLRSLNHILNH